MLTFLFTLLCVVLLGTLRMQPVYRATTVLLIEKEANQQFAFREEVSVDSAQDDYYQTQYQILQSRSLARRTMATVRLEEHPFFRQGPDPLARFEKTVRIEPVRNSRLVNIHVEFPDAVLAARMANALAEAYIQQNVENRFFISRELSGILPSTDGSGGVQAAYKRFEILSAHHEFVDALPSVVNNELIQRLKINLADVEIKYADLAHRYKPKHPSLQRVMAQRQSLQAQIQTETQHILQSLKTQVSGQFKGNNIRVVDPAEVPLKPVRPILWMNLLMASFLGLFGGWGLALLVNYWDTTIKTQEDVEKFLEVPFFGYIPSIKLGKKDSLKGYLYSREAPESPVTEAFRGVRTRLLQMAKTRSPKTLLVTSAGVKEGKTLFSSNLAIILAAGGLRILLVDADLRRPQLGAVWGKPDHNLGFQDLLAGEAPLGAVVQETSVKNVSLVPAGFNCPHPAEILGSKRMGGVLAEMTSQFDLVIFDTPPLSYVTDAMILAPQMDGVLMVVRYGKTHPPIAKRHVERFQETNTPLLGVVINDFQATPGTYSPYGYGCGYYSPYSHRGNGGKSDVRRPSPLSV